MGTVIAITGKGGTGKTTVAALLTGRLIARGCAPVLAVDADPNTGLDTALGVRALKTVGAIREEARAHASKGAGAGISRQEFLELKIAECLVEAADFDLIAMGRSEGPGCYCYANNVLRDILARVVGQYPSIVLDNEAGLENLSRRIVKSVDLMVMTADMSRQGLETLSRLHALAVEMEVRFAKLAVIINRVRGDGTAGREHILKESLGADYVAVLPDDDEIRRRSENGEPLCGIPPDNPVARILDDVLAFTGIAVKRGNGT